MLQKGDKINNYTLEKYLGKGSYGEVWLAKKSIELSDDGILVALKFLSYQPQKDRTQEDFIKQVKREVGTWIKASGHKNIVSVQDGFAFRDDAFVIVSDFAEGGSLGNWLQANGGKSSGLEKTVEIMSEILDGLSHLHSQSPDKIIHRDLKPDNVLFKSGVPCITDFGVSRMSQTITQSMAQVAATSAGTPLYMSPEAFNNQPASRSMDIWSAGVILYQMLSGEFPYYADNPISLALEIISEKPPKPLLNDIPNEFQAIVVKALEKDVSCRFQTAEEMKIGLKNALKSWEFSQNQPFVDKPQSVQSKVTNAVIDRILDQTEVLNTDPTEGWQTVEARKEQQSLAETQKVEMQPGLVGFTELESEEDKRKKDERRKQRRTILGRIIGIVVFMFVGFPLILALLWTISWRNDNQPTANKSGNQNVNKTANLPANNPFANTSPTPNKPDTFKNSIGMEFVKIPAGSFMMGSENGESDEKPVHNVTISKDFYLGKYEVTQVEYEKVMGTNPSYFRNCPRCPVEQVSWNDVQEFIKKLNARSEGTYRLPTEAEWEYACRAGTTGDYAGNLDSMAWYDANSGRKTHEVGTKQANDWGLSDMHGNVWEWVDDWKGDYSGSSQTDPTGPGSGSNRVTRGGSFLVDAVNLRSARRTYSLLSARGEGLGFRVLRQ